MFNHKRFPNYRTVSSMQKNGSLLIKIDAVSNWGFYAVGLMIVSGVFVFGIWMFGPVLFKVRTITEALYCLLPVTFLLLWFMIGLRIILERLCSVELSVERGIFRWRPQIPLWRKDLEARQDNVTAVIAKCGFRGCEYPFRTQPDFPSTSGRNRYSHHVGILIHITPERLFTCPGIRILQGTLFGMLEEETGRLSEKGQLLVAVLEMISLSRQLPCARGWVGRPWKDRQALAAAFVAKSVYGFATTRQLLERLRADRQLRLLCGWNSARHIPHEATFSRAFAQFAASQLPQRLHAALIEKTQQGRLIGHIARDATAIEAREKFPESKPVKAKYARRPRRTRPASAAHVSSNNGVRR